MSAPVRTRPRPGTTPSRPRRGPATGPAARTGAAAKAYTRRTERAQRWTDRAVTAPTGSIAARVPFVALVIGLLATGLVLTLWLSTRAAEDSYTLGAARQTAQQLDEQAEGLRRDVASLDAAPALAQRAAALGMVPSGSVANLVVAPDGTVAVVGTPKAAVPLPVPAPAPAPSPAPVAVAPAPTTAGPAPAANAPAANAPAAPATTSAAPAPVATTTPAAPAPSVAATPGGEQIRPDGAVTGQTPAQTVPGSAPTTAGGAR